MDVVILAGARAGADLEEAAGVAYRCDVKVRGRPMLEAAVEAVRHLGPPVVVAHRDVEGCVRVEPGATMLGSLRSGLAAGAGPRVLIVTADLPFLEAGHVDRFVEAAPPDAGLAYSVALADECEARFPGVRRTSVRLREGRLTGGNLFLVSRDGSGRLLDRLDQAYSARKSPLKLAAMLGGGTLLRFALAAAVPRSLSVDWLEARVSRLLGCRVCAVLGSDPEVATDVDSLEQLRALEDGLA